MHEKYDAYIITPHAAYRWNGAHTVNVHQLVPSDDELAVISQEVDVFTFGDFSRDDTETLENFAAAVERHEAELGAPVTE